MTPSNVWSVSVGSEDFYGQMMCYVLKRHWGLGERGICAAQFSNNDYSGTVLTSPTMVMVTLTAAPEVWLVTLLVYSYPGLARKRPSKSFSCQFRGPFEAHYITVFSYAKFLVTLSAN